MVTIEDPIVADEIALNVTLEKQVTLQLTGVNAAMTPKGRFAALKVTEVLTPETRVAETIAETLAV